MVFGAFPLLFPGFDGPKHQSPAAALWTFYQWFEALAYLHANLVAHLDLGPWEFLLNVGNPLDGAVIRELVDGYEDFFEVFDFQWSITDFGLSIVYDPDSPPGSRKVVGHCAGKLDRPMELYPKMLGPEVWRSATPGSPYCPFKHDVYQLSKSLQAWYPDVAEGLPDLARILKSMASEKPSERPDMSEVMSQMDIFMESLAEQDLERPLVYSTGPHLWKPDHILDRTQQQRTQLAKDPFLVTGHGFDHQHVATGRTPSPVAWPPPTLESWRKVQPDIPHRTIGRARSLWNPLEAFFETLGYTLFVLDWDTGYQVPRNVNEIRAPDPYHVFVGEPAPSRFMCTRNKLCAATKADGTHVVIQLLAIGEDGSNEVQILQRLHLAPISTDYRNRCVPLIDMVTYEPARMVFGIFPLLFPGRLAPSHGCINEALDTCSQVFESVAYLHSNLVAHLDLGPDEFLINVGDALDSNFIEDKRFSSWGNFFHRFTSQWSITDFNLSVMYAPASDPATRKVVGLCGGKLALDVMEYAKMLGPEVWRDAVGQPYCPFKNDVYQVSRLLQVWFPELFYIEFTPLEELLKDMAADDPNLRPAMHEVITRFQALVGSIPEDVRTQVMLMRAKVYRTDQGRAAYRERWGDGWLTQEE
ncbi:hypothetical protein P389DRAFT_11633 [Cystobasidium minutum MCA 4210]|uniref:uncharacterized protein n=1 Tax=Cystobasidium minutum MCA 4210 TaxID=1397322 RepID=UPI0034CDC211|eukprot:jgi/Rhomi1/11633/CE11632_510